MMKFVALFPLLNLDSLNKLFISIYIYIFINYIVSSYLFIAFKLCLSYIYLIEIPCTQSVNQSVTNSILCIHYNLFKIFVFNYPLKTRNY